MGSKILQLIEPGLDDGDMSILMAGVHQRISFLAPDNEAATQLIRCNEDDASKLVHSPGDQCHIRELSERLISRKRKILNRQWANVAAANHSRGKVAVIGDAGDRHLGAVHIDPIVREWHDPRSAD